MPPAWLAAARRPPGSIRAPGEAEDRREQRDGGHHHHGDDDRGGEAEHGTYGMPEIREPQIAMTTVVPAKSTACPAVVERRCPTVASTSRPSARFSR